MHVESRESIHISRWSLYSIIATYKISVYLGCLFMVHAGKGPSIRVPVDGQ